MALCTEFDLCTTEYLCCFFMIGNVRNKKTTPTLPPNEIRMRAPGAHVRRLKSALHNLWNCCCFSGGGVIKWVVSWVLKWILDMKIKKENFKHVILFSDGSGRERFSPEWLLRDTSRNPPPLLIRMEQRRAVNGGSL